MLHRPVRAHPCSASELQGSYISWRRLLNRPRRQRTYVLSADDDSVAKLQIILAKFWLACAYENRCAPSVQTNISRRLLVRSNDEVLNPHLTEILIRTCRSREQPKQDHPPLSEPGHTRADKNSKILTFSIVKKNLIGFPEHVYF